MYEQFFGFSERPFDLTPDPRYLVLTSVHREALNNLKYAIASRKGVTLLIGEAGTGKTTVIRAAIERQPDKTHCVHLHNPALTRAEFVQMLAAQFSLSERARFSKADLLLELEQLLRRRRDAQETTMLIVDEAQSLPLELLEEVRLLSNIETNSEKLMSLVIAGQPELGDRLSEQSLRQLKQRIALRCELRPLSLRESARYVAGRITAAGGAPSRVFTREAFELIHQYSRGIPRTINVIADNALLGGFAAEQRPVTRQIVLDVCHDFAITLPQVAAGDEVSVITPGRSPDSLSTSEQRIVDSAVAVAPHLPGGAMAHGQRRLQRLRFQQTMNEELQEPLRKRDIQ